MKAVIDANGLFPSDMLDEMIAGYLVGNADQLWLTAGGDTPRALAYCAPERMTAGSWNMLLIAVDPGHQGRGLGTALTVHIENVVAARGGRLMLVETSGLPEFARTRAFYAARGYVEEARIRGFYAEGEDKIVFWKTLGANTIAA